MKAIKNKIKISILTAAIAASFFAGNPASAEEAQGTDGAEMQVMEPEILEIQIGKEWAGKEFRLRTDVYMYPGTITVGEDGVLRTELGGSKNYILSVVDTGSDEKQAFTTEHAEGTETSGGDTKNPDLSMDGSKDSDHVQKGDSKAEDPDTIPKQHIILFAAGMTAAVGGLIAIHIVQKRRDMEYEDEYEEDDEYEE